MKRYLVFTGMHFYPQKAWRDFRGEADTLEEAYRIALKNVSEWWQIVDTTTLRICEEGDTRDPQNT